MILIVGPKTASTYSIWEQWSHRNNRHHRDNGVTLDNGSQNNRHYQTINITRTISHRVITWWSHDKKGVNESKVKENGGQFLTENKGKQEHTVLLDNEGQVFSSYSFMEKLEQLEMVRRGKATVKTRNADARSDRKKAMAVVEREWVRIKEQHDVNVKACEVKCQQLASGNVPKQSWPKKPVRPQKPKLPSSVEEIAEGDDNNNNEDDGGEDNEGLGWSDCDYRVM